MRGTYITKRIILQKQLEKKLSYRLEHEKKVKREIQKQIELRDNKNLENYCDYLSTLHTY
jgi:hypothetical protein